MSPPNPPPPPPRATAPTPAQLLSAAAVVLRNDEPVLDGRRSVTSAALTRQAVEASVDDWLQANGMEGRSNRREAFLCLAALHPDPDLARQLHNVWARLSSACHAISYDLPPTAQELERWMAVVHRFVNDDPAANTQGTDQRPDRGTISFP